MEYKKGIISCGKCYRKYGYLLLGVTVIYSTISVLTVIFIQNPDEKKLDINNTFNIMSYIFFISLGESFMIIPDLILKKSISSKNNSQLAKKSKYLSIKYIYNNSSKFSLKEKIYFICAGILKLFLDLVYIIYKLHIEKEKNIGFILLFTLQFELIFLCVLSKLLSDIHFYRHQYLSIIILATIDLARFIIRYNQESVLIFFRNLAIHISYSFLKSLITIYLKGLMDFKFLTPYKACYIFGFINLLIITIAYIISSFIPCNKLLCNVNYNDQKYFAHILTIFNYSGLFLFFVFILKAVISALNYIVIHDFSVCHSILIIQCMQVAETGSFMYLPGSYNSIKLIFMVLFAFINIFFILIFLEIIELNICNMSYNTQKNIERRATDDKNIEFAVFEEKIDFEEEEKENEEDSPKNKNNDISISLFN